LKREGEGTKDQTQSPQVTIETSFGNMQRFASIFNNENLQNRSHKQNRAENWIVEHSFEHVTCVLRKMKRMKAGKNWRSKEKNNQ